MKTIFGRARSLAPVALSFLLATLTVSGAPAADAATLKGTARYEGPDVRLRAIRMNADPNCEKLHGDEKVLQDDKVIGEGGELANVFVYLEEVPAGAGPFAVPEEPVTLEQNGCMYQPKVQGIRVKQNLDVINADPTLHNVRCLARENRPFNLGQPAEGKRTKFFTKPEKAIKFKCDVHPWMASYIFVMEHPFFATTNEKGEFEIPGLPAGTHTFVAWHEVFGEAKAEVEVADGVAEVNFVFDGAE